MVGTIYSLLPAFSLVVFGALTGPEIFSELFGRQNQGWSFWMPLLAGAVGFIAYIQLVAYLALYLKMFSIPVSIVLFWLISYGYAYLVNIDTGSVYNYHIVSDSLWFAGFYIGFSASLFPLIRNRVSSLAAR